MAKPRSSRHTRAAGHTRPGDARPASDARPAGDTQPGGDEHPAGDTHSAGDAAHAGVAADDARMFRAAVSDATPLQHTPRALESNKPRAHRRVSASSPAAGYVPAQDLLGDVVAADDSPTGADPLSFRRPGVRTQTLRRLRRGLYPIEDELDLHGLSQAAARDSLADFIAFNRDAGRRCVRIVHGKGYRSGARGPILKIGVNTWLRRHTDVMAFTSARAIDGGTGAVYVLLRA